MMDARPERCASRTFVDAHGKVRVLAIRVHDFGWNAELDGEEIPLYAFRDICIMLDATRETS